MKGILTLIRLHQRELDALRRQLAQYEEQKEQLLQLAASLHAQLLQERAIAAENPSMAAYMVEYEKRMRERQLDIAKQVIELDGHIEQLAQSIAESFGELKKYEITRDAQLARAKAEADRREQDMLDEIAIQQFARKDDTNN